MGLAFTTSQIAAPLPEMSVVNGYALKPSLPVMAEVSGVMVAWSLFPSLLWLSATKTA